MEFKLSINKDNVQLDDIETLLKSNFDENDETSVSVEPITEDWKSKYMYLLAEFDNYKKRNYSVIEETVHEQVSKLIKSLLECIDDFELLLNNSNDDGLLSVYSKIKKFLTDNNIEKIETKSGELFNEDLHEALITTNTDIKSANNLIDTVFRSGYKLHEKIIRYPMVSVLKYTETN